MAIMKISPSTPSVTETSEILDMRRVHQFYVLYRNRLPVEPLTVLRDPETNFFYFVNGHHRAYGAFLAGEREIDAVELKTDYDVRECNRGKAKDYSSFRELLDKCKSDYSISGTLGVEKIHDYQETQRTPLDWVSKPIIHIVSLNPTIDRCEYARTEVAAGKGFNIARNLMQLGYDNICTYALAGGNNGNLLARLINDQNIPFYITSILDETISTRITSPFTRKRDQEQNPEVRFTELQDLESKLEGALREEDILVLAGSLPRNVRPSIFQEWLSRFKSKVNTAFDTSEAEPFRLAIESAPHIIKPNRDEILTYTGRKNLTIDEIAHETADLRVVKGIDVMLISLDKDGALLIIKEGAYYTPSIEGEVKCSTGAGDALLAGYLAAEANKLTNEQKLAFAMAVARSHISHDGNVGANLNEVNELLPKVQITKLF